MNQPKRVVRQVNVATTKITKKEVDAALAAGITSAKFRNKGVQKRLIKNQEKIRREQALREQHVRRVQKDRERMQKAQQTLANAGKAETVVNEGVAALGSLLGGFPQSVVAAVAAVDTEATTEVEAIDPASVGGDLVDVDFQPENFGVQHASQDDPEGVLTVKLDKLANNQAMINLYGDENVYKPLPEVGARVRADGIVVAVRKFPDGEVPAGEDMAGLQEIDHLFDTLCYAPAGDIVEVSEDGILIRPDALKDLKLPIYQPNSFEGLNTQEYGRLGGLNRKQMFAAHGEELARQSAAAANLPSTAAELNAYIGDDEISRMYPHVIERLHLCDHVQDIDIAATYQKPEAVGRADQKQAMFAARVEESMQARPETFTDDDGPAVKVQNSSLSGAFLSRDPALDRPSVGMRVVKLENSGVSGVSTNPDAIISTFGRSLHPSVEEVAAMSSTKQLEPDAVEVAIAAMGTPLFKAGAHEALTHQCREAHVFDPLLVEPKEQCPASDMAEAETNRMLHGDAYLDADLESARNTAEVNAGRPAFPSSDDSQNKGSVVPFSQLSEDDPDYSQKRRDFIEQSAINRVASGNTEGIYVKPTEEKKDEDAQ